jgi:GNAT superfamily N-acetyltransferase
MIGANTEIVALKSRYGIEVRGATAADAAGLAELLRAAGQIVSARELADRLEAMRSEPSAILLAGGWGAPIGLIVLHWYRRLDANHPVACVTALLVDPGSRRRGIGRLLIKAAAQAARSAGCGGIEVMVGRDEAELVAFCEATGFVTHGTCYSRPLRKRSG